MVVAHIIARFDGAVTVAEVAVAEVAVAAAATRKGLPKTPCTLLSILNFASSPVDSLLGR
jgi:hypothetical protein